MGCWRVCDTVCRWSGGSGLAFPDASLPASSPSPVLHQVWSRTLASAGQSALCGNPARSHWKDSISTIDELTPHTANEATIRITTTLNESPDDESWGVNHVRVSTPLQPPLLPPQPPSPPAFASCTAACVGDGECFSGLRVVQTGGVPREVHCFYDGERLRVEPWS